MFYRKYHRAAHDRWNRFIIRCGMQSIRPIVFVLIFQNSRTFFFCSFLAKNSNEKKFSTALNWLINVYWLSNWIVCLFSSILSEIQLRYFHFLSIGLLIFNLVEGCCCCRIANLFVDWFSVFVHFFIFNTKLFGIKCYLKDKYNVMFMLSSLLKVEIL